MILILAFSIHRDWLPATGYEPMSAGLWTWLSHILLPGIAVGTSVAAITARQLRASVIEVMGATHIRTAWAKGSSAPRVVVHHALKNAMTAPLTTFGSMFAHMIGGTVVIETLVGISGIGNLTVGAVRANDIPMLQGIVLFFVVVTVGINLVVDLVYMYANPKVRLS
jgi:peptide/nickel transport system permease protein